MTVEWEGPRQETLAADAAARAHDALAARTVGDSLQIANEFSEIAVRRVDTRNGSRLLIESPRSGQWVTLCPLELEALTWQTTATFSAMVGNPFGSLVSDDEQDR